MSIQILMPALSPTMEEGKLSKWLVKEGDEVHSGDVLAEIETDKATMEFEAVDEGRIGKLLVSEGTEGVKVNQPIAELLQEGEPTTAKPKTAPAQADASPAQRREPKTESLGPRASSPASPQAKKGSRIPNQVGNEGSRQTATALIPESAVPEGTQFATITVREALRDAMAEEMRRDADVFLMGEEVAPTR
jgi:pyruvate dehydrogenase E1 component beta subunit